MSNSIQQEARTRTVFDCLPSSADTICRLFAARGDSDKSIATIKRQFEAVERSNPFHNHDGGDN